MPVGGFIYLTWSNIKPNDLLRQSIPFSYLAVSAASTDGKAHSVQVYTDISAEWVSGDRGLTANWTTTTGSVLTHQVQLASPSLYSENSDQTQCNVCAPWFWKTHSNF